MHYLSLALCLYRDLEQIPGKVQAVNISVPQVEPEVIEEEVLEAASSASQVEPAFTQSSMGSDPITAALAALLDKTMCKVHNHSFVR